jgi:hypothetical protein
MGYVEKKVDVLVAITLVVLSNPNVEVPKATPPAPDP